MRVVKTDKVTIKEIVECLKSNGLVIMPTETVYGAMVDATNEDAVKKLTHYKNRPLGKPFSVAVTDIEMAKEYVEVNETAETIYKQFLPGPVTVISKGTGKVAYGVESEFGTLGIRIPDYKLVLDTVRKLGKPITATSANASYKRRPYKISDILDHLSEKQKSLIDLIVDAGELPRRDPSTVIDTTLEDSVVLRQGDIKLKDEIEVVSRSAESTQNIAKELWQKYEPYYGKKAIIFALEGPMGTGKTQFTKGLAKAMGLEEDVVSPTYSLEEEYDHTLYHIDTWRMESDTELEEIGLKKRIDDKKVLAIEWADKFPETITHYDNDAIIIWVKIRYASEKPNSELENHRILTWGLL